MSMNRNPESAFAALEAELLAESAASLGRAGTKLERAIAALAAGPREACALRTELLDAAGSAAYAFVVQREALGMRDSREALDVYAVPEEVRMRMGRQVAAPPEVEPEDPITYFERLPTARVVTSKGRR